jgi:hypothetical protein
MFHKFSKASRYSNHNGLEYFTGHCPQLQKTLNVKLWCDCSLQSPTLWRLTANENTGLP